ncbi:MAG: hypothetical protein AAGD22_06315 [Verrucomicrobiota bacterium]
MKAKLLIAVGVILVFGMGLVMGVVGTGVWVKNRFQEFSRGDTSRLMQIVARRGAERLDLDKGQREIFSGMVLEVGDDVRMIQEDAGKQVRLMLRTKYEPRLLEILTPEQKEAWEVWKLEMANEGRVARQ